MAITNDRIIRLKHEYYKGYKILFRKFLDRDAVDCMVNGYEIGEAPTKIQALDLAKDMIDKKIYNYIGVPQKVITVAKNKTNNIILMNLLMKLPKTFYVRDTESYKPIGHGIYKCVLVKRTPQEAKYYTHVEWFSGYHRSFSVHVKIKPSLEAEGLLFTFWSPEVKHQEETYNFNSVNSVEKIVKKAYDIIYSFFEEYNSGEIYE
jgi:hypothetical protein